MIKRKLSTAADNGLFPKRRATWTAVSTAMSSAILGLILTQMACAISGISGPRVPADQLAAFDAASGILSTDSAGAESRFKAFIAAYPRSVLVDDAMEQLAQLAFADGRNEKGMQRLASILTDYPRSDRAGPARLRLAQLEFSRDRREAARQLIDRLHLKTLGLADQRAALRLRIALAQTPVERMEQLSLLRGKLGEENEERIADPNAVERLESRVSSVDREIARLISSAASAELEEMLRGLRRRTPASAIILELSRRALDAGQMELASRRIKRAGSLVKGDLEQGELRLLSKRLVLLFEATDTNAELPSLHDLADRPRPRTDGARGTIGVVLPLTGNFAAFGQESLRGILLAADLFAENEGEVTSMGYPDEGISSKNGIRSRDASALRVLVRDSEGDPEKAAAAVRDLALDPTLLAIVGPIFSAESHGAAEAAESAGVPIVTLSTSAGVAAGRVQAFRIRTTPADEVNVLVNYAIDKLEAKRFAVLYPETRYGRGMRKLYWEAVLARGGKMVAASSYEAGSTDFSGSIKDMIGYRFLTNLEKKALDERKRILRAARKLEPAEARLLREAAYSILGPEREPLPPIVDFDVLFIPDASEKIALIAPGLAFHEVKGVRLLGANEWLDEELLTLARRHVSGSVISTPFYSKSEEPIVAEFVEAYRNTFDEMPGVYGAHGFDATNLILVQLAAGRSDRRGVREGLLDTRAFAGATGVLTMRPNGNARRRPFLLGVSGPRFHALD